MKLASLIWGGIALLLIIAILASVNRGSAVITGSLLFDPLRPLLPPSILKDVDTYDQTFVANKYQTLFHTIGGSIFLLAATVQFSPYIRRRYIAFHRWFGRIIILIALMSGIVGLFLMIPFAFTGVIHILAVITFGLYMIMALILAFIAIRRKDVQRHREWMIRAFSIAIGISVVRIVAAIVMLLTGEPTFEMLGFSLWAGWLISVIVGEAYIRRTRHSLILEFKTSS